jgi:hypothetical protein
MTENRLKLIAPELDTRLQQTSSTKLRAIALAVSEIAVQDISLSNPVIDAALEALRTENFGNSKLLKQLETLIEQLDDIQLDLQERVEQGEVDEAEHLAAFSRARAVNSLLFALNADPLTAATGAIYEANAAIDNLEALNKVVTEVLDKES